MRIPRFLAAAPVAAVVLSAAGCFPQYVVPEQLDRQVDRQLTFSLLRADAERYKGSTVVLGGAVLGAKLIPEGTEIEVLELPLDYADRPSGPAEASEGRFLVVDPNRRDPAVLLNRRITVVGEVLGAGVRTVDEAEYVYPLLSSRFIHTWGSGYGYGYEGSYPSYYPYPYAYPYFPSYPYAYTYPYSFYPYFSLDLYPSWYGPSWYSYPHGYDHEPPASSRRRFDPPPGGGPPPPAQRPPASSPGGGMRRRF